MLNRNYIFIKNAVILIGDYELTNGSYKFEVFPRGKKKYLVIDFEIAKEIENHIDYIYVTANEEKNDVNEYLHGDQYARGFQFAIPDDCRLNELKIAAFKIDKEKSSQKQIVREGRIYYSDFIVNYIHPHLLRLATSLSPIKNYNNLKFFQPIKKPLEIVITEKIATEIPEEYCCAISYDLMENPVICTLDNRYYEETIITTWLSRHRTSPYNLKILDNNQSPKDVLKKDNLLKELIQAFRVANPHLFEEKMPASKKKKL